MLNITDNNSNNIFFDNNLGDYSMMMNISKILTECNITLGNCYTPYSQRLETYLVPIIFAIIFVVGVLGNGTLVIIFLRHRAMRNIPNTYIFSLALADLLVIIVCVPMASLIYTLDSWPWGFMLCKITECAKDISIGVSVFTLTALSAERYCAIVKPLRKLQTKPLTVFTAVMIWILAIIFAAPAAIISDTILQPIMNNSTIIVCSPFGQPGNYTATYAKYNIVGKAIIYYFLPLIIIGVLYALMARRLHLSAREMPGELAGPQSRAQARARRHVARMVVTFVIVFIICFLPMHIFSLWFHLNPNSLDEYDDFWHILRIIGFCFSFLNSCVNPVALYCVSGVFRQHFHRYLCCKPMPIQNRLGLSSVGTGADTSFMSTIRRTTNHGGGGGGGGGGGTGGDRRDGGCSTNNNTNNNNNNNNNNNSNNNNHHIVNGSPTQSIILNDKSSVFELYISEED